MKERIWYLDFLRIFATFMVIVLHISAQNFGEVPVTSYEWDMFNAFDSITRWTVPVFVMISGALFLQGEQSTEKIYKKYILRMITAFAFWSAIYAVFDMMRTNCGIKEAVWNFFVGHVHLWFLYMIIGVYMLIPILRRIAVSNSAMKYFLVLGVLFACCIPQGINVLSYVFPRLEKLTTTILGKVDFRMATGYVFYFVLGFYLYQIEISKKMQKLIYFGGLLGMIVTMLMTKTTSVLAGYAKTDFYGYFTINVLLMSVAIYVFFKYRFVVKPVGRKAELISKMSKYSFGVYLVHMLVIDSLDLLFGFDTLSFNPMLSVLVMAIVVFIISSLISGLLHYIPILKKYVV